MVRALVVRFAFTTAMLLPLATPVRADLPWPADGAPVCTSPGHQIGLLGLERFCMQGMAFSWFTHSAVGDTLYPFGSFGVSPPTGDCANFVQTVPAGFSVSEVSTARLSSGAIFGLPGCIDPAYPGHVWIGRTETSDEVVLSVPQWFGHPRTVVHSADLITQYTPVLAGSGFFGYIDTAVVVVWADNSVPPSQLRARRATWSGAFEWGGADGIFVAPTAAPQGAPQAVRLGDGSTLIIWVDGRNGGSDTYAQRLLANGTPAPGWPATGLALEGRAEDSLTPRIVGELYGSLYVVWAERGPRFGGFTHTSIVARKLLPTGLPDPAWSDSGIVVTSSATVDELGDVQSNSARELAFVWSDSRAATLENPTDVYAQRMLADGTRPLGWPASGLALCTAPGPQNHVVVGLHPSGATIFAWEDLRSGEADVYATMRNPEGLMPCCDWLADGNPVSQAPGEQRGPIVRAGNDGGGFVAWEDSRNLATSGIDLYAQAFTADGRNADVGPRPPVEVATLRTPTPNPSRLTTRLVLDLPREAHVHLDVYDVVGRHVYTVAEGTLSAGPHAWTWLGTDDAGRRVAAGLYHVRARVDGTASSRTIVRLR
jgi:hypothetical protein